MGLWMYNYKGFTARSEIRRRGVEALREGALPVMHSEGRTLDIALRTLPFYQKSNEKQGRCQRVKI